jgi:antirestriction protein ArdC
MNQIEKVSGMFLDALQNGTAPWLKPWKAGHRHCAINAISKAPYRGINQLMLTACDPSGGKDPRWLTFNQAKKLGCYVKKGSKGVPIVFWNVVKKENENGDEKVFPVLKSWTVFHASQIEGLVEWEQPEEPEALLLEINAEAERIVANSGARIIHDQNDRCFYVPTLDEIHMVPAERFGSSYAYYATLLHELAHWTGHKSRLDRLSSSRVKEDYAFEELIAEIASYMMAQRFGFEFDPSQHVSYVASWVRILQDKPKAILDATSAASRILTYLCGEEEEEEAGE